MHFLFAMATAAAFVIAGSENNSKSQWECVSFSPDGKWLLACGGQWLVSGKAKIWECQKWKLHAEWKSEFSSSIPNARFVSNEEFVTLSERRETDKRKYDGNEMRFWNISKKKQIEVVYLENSRSSASRIDYFPEKKMAVFNQWKPFGTIGLNAVPSLENKVNFGNDLDYNTWCRFSPDFKKVMVLSGLELQLFEIATRKCLNRRKLEKCDYETGIRVLTISPDGKSVAVGLAYPNRICIFSSDLESLLLAIERKSPPSFAVFSPDSKTLAIANDDNGIELFSIEMKKATKVLKLGKERVRSCCFSSDATMMAVGIGPEVQVVAAKTGKVLANLK